MEQYELLRQIPLFTGMDDEELKGIRSLMSAHEFLPGQVIIRQGERGDHFYIILEGEVQFLTQDGSGNELILDEEGAGGFFGELSMLTGEPRQMRVRAKSKVATLALERDEFHSFILKHPHAGIDVLTALGKRLYQTDKMLRQSIVRNVNEVHDEELGFGQRIADGFAAVMGSWPFIIVQSCLLLLWVGLNVTGWVYSWDPYPFILLNLALSFQAAYAAPIIMMSQNRQSDKDRLAAEIDHEVNVKAEVQVRMLMRRLDDLESGMHLMHEEHVTLLKEMRGKALT